MTRYYFTCPIIAAYFAKYMGMTYVIYAEDLYGDKFPPEDFLTFWSGGQDWGHVIAHAKNYRAHIYIDACDYHLIPAIKSHYPEAMWPLVETHPLTDTNIGDNNAT